MDLIKRIFGRFRGAGHSRGRSQGKPEFRTIEQIVEAYPKLYSQKRFDEWRQLFDDHAVIGRAGLNGEGRVVGIDLSVKDQQKFARANGRLREDWTNVRVQTYGNIAIVAADYVLETDGNTRTGIDVLLLVASDSGWRIMGLAYDEQCK